jgi:putative ABC transport system permease protein
MLRNYLLTAWRYLLGNRLFSLINIFGLALGLMSCILILLFVRDELYHDSNFVDADRIVRLHTAFLGEGRPPFLTVRSAGRMMEALRDYAPDQVEAGVRLLPAGVTVSKDAKVFAETITFADASLFDVFALPLLHGSREHSFRQPMDLLVSEKLAHKYFGRSDVVGEVLTVCCLGDERLEVKITGVMQDLPRSSHLDVEMLAVLEPSMFADMPNLLDTWTSVNTYTYFKLRPGVTPGQFKERIWHWTDSESPFVEMIQGEGKPTDSLQPNVMALPDIYLKARRDAGSMGDMRPLGDVALVYSLAGIALMILLVAAVNFMNLSTARSARRAREVALRKVLGASRTQVAVQFLGEAVAISIAALLFALVAVEIVVPFYNSAVNRELELNLLNDLPMLLALVGIAIVVGLVSGSYPALHLSSFRPALILKANQSTGENGAAHVRSLLVIFQYGVSIGLAVCTAVVYSQTMYARSMDVGYSIERKLVLGGIGGGDAGRQRQTLTSELQRIPGVTSVVLSSEVPSEDNENNTGFRLLDGGGSAVRDEEIILNYYSVGFGFFEAYDMTISHGRGFDRGHSSDELKPIAEDENRIGRSSIVLNQSAVRELGIASPEDAIGRVLRGSVFGIGEYDLEVIGVAEDVYFRSIRFGIRPSVYLNNPTQLRAATISFTGTDSRQLVADVERTWSALVPMEPVQYRFLADMVKAQYDDEERQAAVFAVFSFLAMIIASLGLYGLASFAAERRTREIGIRKVLGARVRDIVSLLIWQFSLPVLIANLLAWPVAWYLMSNWLESFHYRIGDGFILLVSLVAGVISLLIAWMTVAGRAMAVARANPVHALRYE